MSKYVAIFWVSFRHCLKNYKAWLGLSIFLITCLVIFSHIWQIAASKKGAIHFTPSELLWYIALNEWVLISLPDIHEDMEEDLRSGRLAYLLPRPISYLGATFATALGSLFVNLLTLGAVTFLFTWWQVGFPFHFTSLFFTFIFAISSGIIGVLFLMLIGMLAFWIREINPVFWMFEKLLLMLGGLMLPLSIYPLWMQKLALFTPFPAILSNRSHLVIDSAPLAMTHLAITLAFWTAFASLVLYFLYRKGEKILNIEGG